MPRTTSDAVIGVLGKQYKPKYPTTFAIETANVVVTAVCEQNTQGIVYNVGLLELIERWLSAHFYCIQNPQRRFSSVGKVQESTDSKVDIGLDQTRFGQMAKSIDHHGLLAQHDFNTNNPQIPIKTKMFWAGTELE